MSGRGRYSRFVLTFLSVLSCGLVMLHEVNAGWIDVGRSYDSKDTVDPNGDGFNSYLIKASDDEEIEWDIKVDGYGSVEVYFCNYNVTRMVILLGAIEYIEQYSDPSGVKEASHTYSVRSEDKGTFSIVVVPTGDSNVTYDISIKVKQGFGLLWGLVICCLPPVLIIIVVVVLRLIIGKKKGGAATVPPPQGAQAPHPEQTASNGMARSGAETTPGTWTPPPIQAPPGTWVPPPVQMPPGAPVPSGTQGYPEDQGQQDS